MKIEERIELLLGEALHIHCEECGVKFSDKTGREYVKAYGGKMLDLCKKCADKPQLKPTKGYK